MIIKPLTGPLTQLNDSTLIGQNVGVGWVEVYVPETTQNQGLRDTIQVEVLDSVTSLKDLSSLETSETQVQYDASGQIQAQDRPRQSGILLQTQKGQINLR